MEYLGNIFGLGIFLNVLGLGNFMGLRIVLKK